MLKVNKTLHVAPIGSLPLINYGEQWFITPAGELFNASRGRATKPDARGYLSIGQRVNGRVQAVRRTSIQLVYEAQTGILHPKRSLCLLTPERGVVPGNVALYPFVPSPIIVTEQYNDIAEDLVTSPLLLTPANTPVITDFDTDFDMDFDVDFEEKVEEAREVRNNFECKSK
jgi:hypothetical protein